MRITLAMLALIAGPAAAQQCGATDDLRAALSARYGETVIARGLDAQGRLVEMWGADTGTWTLTVTTPQGLTCIVGAGEGFEAVAAPKGEAL